MVRGLNSPCKTRGPFCTDADETATARHVRCFLKHATSQIKCHSSKFVTSLDWNSYLGGLIQPPPPPCLIKSVVESSVVNPGRSIMATQQDYKYRATHMFHHWESHWQHTASGNWWCTGSTGAGQDVSVWAWCKKIKKSTNTPLFLSTN